MKLHGWCQTCQRVKRVTVRVIGKTMPVGECDDCRDAREQRRS